MLRHAEHVISRYRSFELRMTLASALDHCVLRHWGKSPEVGIRLTRTATLVSAG
jgi:hypothetical protein